MRILTAVFVAELAICICDYRVSVQRENGGGVTEVTVNRSTRQVTGALQVGFGTTYSNGLSPASGEFIVHSYFLCAQFITGSQPRSKARNGGLYSQIEGGRVPGVLSLNPAALYLH
jgi:hypothetical protein